jgi:hypothetical protein
MTSGALVYTSSNRIKTPVATTTRPGIQVSPAQCTGTNTCNHRVIVHAVISMSAGRQQFNEDKFADRLRWHGCF